jgi:hypothetical protein
MSKTKRKSSSPLPTPLPNVPLRIGSAMLGGLQVVIEELRRTISCIVQKHEHDHH